MHAPAPVMRRAPLHALPTPIIPNSTRTGATESLMRSGGSGRSGMLRGWPPRSARPRRSRCREPGVPAAAEGKPPMPADPLAAGAPSPLVPAPPGVPFNTEGGPSLPPCPRPVGVSERPGDCPEPRPAPRPRPPPLGVDVRPGVLRVERRGVPPPLFGVSWEAPCCWLPGSLSTCICPSPWLPASGCTIQAYVEEQARRNKEQAFACRHAQAHGTSCKPNMGQVFDGLTVGLVDIPLHQRCACCCVGGAWARDEDGLSAGESWQASTAHLPCCCPEGRGATDGEFPWLFPTDKGWIERAQARLRNSIFIRFHPSHFKFCLTSAPGRPPRYAGGWISTSWICLTCTPGKRGR